MELRNYLEILWRRKWVVVIATVVVAVFAAIATFTATPIFVSSTTLRVATIGGGIADLERPDLNYTDRLMNTYANIVTSNSVRTELMRELNLATRPELSVELVPGTELMRLDVEAADPTVAQSIAIAATDALIESSQELYSGVGLSTQEILQAQLDQLEQELNDDRGAYESLLTSSPDDTAAVSAASQAIALKERTYATLLEQYERSRVNEALRANSVSVVESASLPIAPAKPRHLINLILGVVAGFMGGVVLAFIVNNMDTTLYTTKEIEETMRLSTVGQIPTSKGSLEIVHISEGGYQPELEAFRRLRTNILAANENDASKTIIVTSAERGEGKSTIISNLAVSIAQSGRRVLVVDCDLRLPTIHKLFDLQNERGLTDVIVDKVSFDKVVQITKFSRVQVLTSGSLPPNPTELLDSPQMRELMSQLREEYDIVLFDTPALLSVTDAAVLVPHVDRVVMVVAQTVSRRDAVLSVRQQLDTVNAKSIGVVVNRVPQNGKLAY